MKLIAFFYTIGVYRAVNYFKRLALSYFIWTHTTFILDAVNILKYIGILILIYFI